MDRAKTFKTPPEAFGRSFKEPFDQPLREARKLITIFTFAKRYLS